MGRFTFPSESDAGFDIKLQDSQTTVTADTAQIVGNDEVQGSVTTGDFCGECVNDGQSQLYTVYFDIKFNQPFSLVAGDHGLRADQPVGGLRLLRHAPPRSCRRRSASPT